MPSWRQAGLLSKFPSLPAEPFHPNGSAHSPTGRAGLPRQTLMGRGRRAGKGPCRLAPVCQPQAPRFPAWWGGVGLPRHPLPVASQDVKLSTYSAAHPSQNNSSCLQREGAEIIKGSRQGGTRRGAPPSSSFSPSPPTQDPSGLLT